VEAVARVTLLGFLTIFEDAVLSRFEFLFLGYDEIGDLKVHEIVDSI